MDGPSWGAIFTYVVPAIFGGGVFGVAIKELLNAITGKSGREADAAQKLTSTAIQSAQDARASADRAEAARDRAETSRDQAQQCEEECLRREQALLRTADHAIYDIEQIMLEPEEYRRHELGRAAISRIREDIARRIEEAGS